jgi:hypothetical protein
MAEELYRKSEKSRRNRIVGAACFVALIAVPVAEAFRGLDLTDMGFVLTNQRFVFGHPERVAYWFHLWLTNVVGGLVDLLFGRFGVLPHKLAAAAIFWATLGSIACLYRKKVPGILILAALTISMAFDFFNKINIVHYNNLSALLYALGAAALCEAATGAKRRMYFLSGFVLALNVFARVPNVIGLGLIAVPWALGLFIRDPDDRFRLGWKDYASFMAGALAAVLASLIAMALLGHLGHYLHSLNDLANSRTMDAGSYGLGAQVKRPLRDIFRSLAYGLPFAAALGLVSAAVSLFRRRLVRLALLIAIGLAACFVAPSIFRMRGTILYFPAGICYWASLATLLDKGASRGLKLATAMSACLCLALNVGSDTGINVASYLFPAMFPALLAFSRASARAFRLGKSAAYAPLRDSVFVVIAFFAGVSIFMIANGVYRDVNSMVRTARVEQLGHEFTSEPRAAALEEAMAVIEAAAPPESVLFAYDSICLIHFATRTLPYLDNPWPAQYHPDYLKRLLKEKERREPLPPVLLAKRNPRSNSWPDSSRSPVHLETVMEFLDRNGYRLSWESSAFALYLPGSVGGRGAADEALP